MTTQNDRQALKQARDEGVAEAIRELRTFTGIAGYTPPLDRPEHQAYFAYEQDLASGLEVWRDHLTHRQGTVDTLIERREDARKLMDAEQRRRLEERGESNAGGRVLGKLLDVTFPEKRTHAALSKEVDQAWESRHAADTRVMEIQDELARVSNWIDHMLLDVDAARTARP